MIAAITKNLNNAQNLEPKKERVNTLRIVAMLKGSLQTVCEARFYMARRSDGASPVYCSLWVHGDTHTSGYGRASGYGYHKESAALQAAIDSAGIKLTGDPYGRTETDKVARIDGVGSSAMESAMHAIATAAGADPTMMTLA